MLLQPAQYTARRSKGVDSQKHENENSKTTMDSLNITFDIPNTPENLAAYEKLREESLKGTITAYWEDERGNMIPIANIEKHPECPDKLYKDFLDAILNIR